MPNYDMNELVNDYKEAGKPPYTAFHKELVEKLGKGNYPALETFRKALVKDGAIPDRGEAPKGNAPAKGQQGEERIVLEPLTNAERKDFDAFDKEVFATWVIENKPGVWREYFNKDVQIELLKKRIADLEAKQAR